MICSIIMHIMYFIRVTDKQTCWLTECSHEHIRWYSTIEHKHPLFGDNPIRIVDIRTDKDATLIKDASFSYPTSVLKSNIQKTIRRGKLMECLSTTQQLLRQDTGDALRRLPIIFLEDAMIHHESFSLVVWLMAAQSKGYKLSAHDEQLILDAVATAYSAPYRYSRGFLGKGFLGKSLPKTDTSYSLLVRALYGGMHGDMTMLTNMAHRIDTMEVLTEWVRAPFVEPFDVERHIIPESIDFHCYPTIVTWCSEKTSYPQDEVRSAIWMNWSSPNVRTLIEPSEEEDEYPLVYNEIHPILVSYARYKIEWMAVSKIKLLTQTKLTQFMKTRK